MAAQTASRTLPRRTDRPVSAAIDVARKPGPVGSSSAGWLRLRPTPTKAAPPARSHSTPPSLRPPTRRSLGHLTCTRMPGAADSTARAAARPIRSGRVHAPLGPRGPGNACATVNQSPLGESEAQRLPRRPRPAVWRSATTRSGNGRPARTRAAARSLVESVRSWNSAVATFRRRAQSPTETPSQVEAVTTAPRTTATWLLPPTGRGRSGGRRDARARRGRCGSRPRRCRTPRQRRSTCWKTPRSRRRPRPAT